MMQEDNRKDAAANSGSDGVERNGAASEQGDGPTVAPQEPEIEAAAAPETPAAGDDEAPAEPDESASVLKDQLLRALADAENTRRRAKKDVEDARRYAIANFARDLLGVADNMQRALDSIPAEARAGNETVGAIAEGVEITARELDAVFSRFGITKIDPLGEPFDYNLHQALFETAETDQEDGTVVQVAQVGYTIGDRLLRAAMVGVAKGGEAADSTGESAERSTDSDAGADGEAAPGRGGRVDTSA